MLVLSELRPNNLYMVKNNVVVALEDHLNDGTQFLLYFHGMPSGVDFKEVRPIPLTDHWLRQMGLVERYVKGEWSWANCTKKGEWGADTEIHNDGGIYYYNIAYPPIEYVHQLQNLYAALTREEMPYKAEVLQPSKEAARIQYLEAGIDGIRTLIMEKVKKIDHIENPLVREMCHTLKSVSLDIKQLLENKL